ncbi:type II CAAX endopeptidase family protein [Synechocystis sp. LKSZ1]|uniref:CPBP family intramembrane glutamic endopeptidase n=1 Tax=Synechocystis sp. LKSZ1 TaxID=3144951 RepID=UPI00336C29D2
MKTSTFNPAQLPAPLRLGLFILALLVLWLPWALFAYGAFQPDTNLTTIVAMGGLFLLFLALLRWWTRRFYGQSQAFAYYGLVASRRNGWDTLQGLALGFAMTAGLFTLEALFGWVTFQSPVLAWGRLIWEGSLTGLGVAFAEELFFRGWFLTELQRDYTLRVALGGNALFFAILHFLKPLGEILRTFPQFPALVLLGLILGLAKNRHGHRLGYCIGLHGGLVWAYYIVNVGQLVQYSDNIFPWLTGVDGNPLAGVMGLMGLCILLFIVQKQQTEAAVD